MGEWRPRGVLQELEDKEQETESDLGSKLFPVTFCPFPALCPLFTAHCPLFFYNLLMQILTLSRRRTDAFPPEAFTPELAAKESARVKELYAAGILRQIWLRGDVPGATILWEATGEDEVRAALGSLPIFQAGMLEIVAVVPLRPYPGFGPTK